MHKVLSIAAVVAALASPATAQNDQPTTAISGPDLFFEADPNQVIQQIESARECELIGPLISIGGHQVDKNSARCHSELGRIKFFNGNIQFGIIERLNAAKVPVEGLKKLLSDPVNLKRFQDEWAEPMHLLVVSMIDNDDDIMSEKNGEMSSLIKKHLRGFVTRRIAEAQPTDRAEVARIWGEIAITQFQMYVSRDDLMPDFLNEVDNTSPN